MSNVPEFLKINDGESELDYFLRIYNTPINERYGKSVFNLDSADGISDDPVIRPEKDELEEGTIDGNINGYNYIEDNYTDRVFDRLTVIGRDADVKACNPYYVCKCKCGNVKSIALSSLLRGVTKSCGCLKKESDKPNDLTDIVFGKLKVRCLDEERTAQTHRGYWICDCECGGSKSIRSDALLSGKTTSCGCVLAASRHRPNTAIMNDLTDREFGSLKVIERDWDHDSRQGVYWICECKCGNRKSIRGADLLNGKTKTCGCGQSCNLYDLSGEYGIGYTANGTRFLFDKEDYYKIAPYTWGTDAYGYIVAHYRDSNGERKSIKMHRLVMDVTDPKIFIDHIHHNLADNRKEELRIVTHSENLQNTKLSIVNTSGHTGVYYNSINHNWRALIGLNNKIIDLGSYPTKEEAIRVREEAEIKYFGEHRYQGTIATDQILQRTASNPEPTRVTRSNPFENVPKNPTSSIQNLNSANTSGYNGVYFDKLNNNWRARIRVNGKLISLGSYPTAEEAYRARLEADKKYLGR